VSNQLSKWRNNEWSFALESLDPKDQSLWMMTIRVIRIATSSPPLFTTRGLALSDSEKAGGSCGQCGGSTSAGKRPSVLAVIEIVKKAMRACSFALANEPKISNSAEV